MIHSCSAGHAKIVFRDYEGYALHMKTVHNATPSIQIGFGRYKKKEGYF